MNRPDYPVILGHLRNRYRQLDSEITERLAEKTALSKAIHTLSAVCGEPPNIDVMGQPSVPDPGKLMAESWLKFMPFVDAIRTALRMISPLAFTTSELKELLTRAGYPVHTKNDFMVALNVALKRFHDQEEVEIASKDGRKAYRWAYKNEMSPPPGYQPLIDWEALVSEADKSQDEIADDHPMRRLMAPVRNDLPKTPAEAKERMQKFARPRTVQPPPGFKEEK
jgi:hypothetical protein